MACSAELLLVELIALVQASAQKGGLVFAGCLRSIAAALCARKTADRDVALGRQSASQGIKHGGDYTRSVSTAKGGVAAADSAADAVFAAVACVAEVTVAVVAVRVCQ